MNQSPLPAKLTIALTKEMQEKLLPLLNIEVEILQGTREELPDGRTRFTCEINDLDKYEMLRDFALKAISNAEQPVTTN